MYNPGQDKNLKVKVQQQKKPILIYVGIAVVLLMLFFAVYLATPTKNLNLSHNNKVVNQQYYHALHNANQGKVDVAIAQLKVILKEHPKYMPAKKLYKSLTARSHSKASQ